MPDVRISELPALTTVLTTALLCVVQAGTTYKATVTDVLLDGLTLDGGTLSKSASGLKVAAGGISSTELADGAVDLSTAKVTGVAPVSKGGTGLSSLGTSLQVLRTNAGATAAEWATFEALAAGSAAGQPLIWNGSAWGGAALDLADGDARTGRLPFANISTVATDVLLGRDTAGTGDIEAITLNATLSFTGAGALQRAALTGDVTASAGSNATTIANSAVTTVKIADANVTLAKLANIATDSLIGRDTAASGVPEVISLNATLSMTGTGSLQRAALTGDVTAAAGSNTTAIAADVIVDADINSAAAIAHSKLANLAGRSVLGRNVATSGAPAAITGGGSGTVLYDNGATISFQPIQISAISNVATDRILGRDTAGTGVVEELNLDSTLEFSGAGTIRRAGITGDITIAVGSNTSAITAGAIINADVNAAAAIAGTKISPNFGAQDIITTGSLLLGASPASSGAVRLTNNEFINFKSQAGTTVTGIGMSSTDRISIGSSSATILAMDFGVGTTGSFNFNIGGTAVLDIDSNSVDMGAGIVALRFASTTSAVSVGPISNTGTAVTGIGTTFLGQDVTGTGATVGGVTRLRGANSTNGTGGALSLRSGTGPTANGAFTAEVGTTVFLFADGSLTYPTVGMLRSPHASPILTGRTVGGADKNVVRWGHTANDTATFGDATVPTEILGSTVEIGDGTTYIEVATLATNREIVSLLLGADLTTTQMPANTGDKVVFWADATTMPTSGFPTSGGILGVDSALGLEWKGKNGVETTIAPHGDSGNTTKRRIISWKSRPERLTTATSASTFTAAFFDVAAFNGQGITNGMLTVTAHFMAIIDTSSYAVTSKITKSVQIIAGAVTVGTNTDAVPLEGFGASVPYDSAVVDSSGTVVRLRIDPFNFGTNLETFAYFEVSGFAL